jgi:hypothetical protein
MLIIFAIHSSRQCNMLFKLLSFMLLGMGVLSLSVVDVPEAWGAGVPETQITHEQLLSFVGESAVPIKVTVNDPAGVTEVRCYFRFDSFSPFVYSEMVGAEDDLFTTRLPIPIATIQKIEYLFLVVNGQKQVTISETFTLNKKQLDDIRSTDRQISVPEWYQLKSEVDGADTVKDFFLQPANVSISLVPQQIHYGVLAGLYSEEQLSSEVVTGYFGAFRLDRENKIVAAKGYIVTRRSCEPSLLQEKSTAAKETVAGEQVYPPDISGDGWTGIFWRSDNLAETAVSVHAIVTQNPDGRVTVTTSKTGLGHYFAGNIDITGHMLIYDAYDSEVWSTHYGPATDIYIKIADYVRPPSLFDLYPPLNIIELTRKPRVTLEVNKAGTGNGDVTGGGIYTYGTTQQIDAAAYPGSTFNGWKGDGCNGPTNSLDVILDGNKICTATFTLNSHILKIIKTGGGTVKSDPGGIDCGTHCAEAYDFGTNITLAAIPDANNIFVGWSKKDCAETGECIVRINANMEISAIFKSKFPWTMLLPVLTKGVQ